jgi:hypothetical protein
MRPDFLVLASPLLDAHARFGTVPEPVHVEALIAKLPVEAVVGGVLSGLSRGDKGALDAGATEPAEHGKREELRTVVRAQGLRRATRSDEPVEHFDDAGRANAPADIDGERFVGPLVDHGEALELLPVRARIEDEVVGPDLIGTDRGMRSRAARRKAPSALSLGDLKPRLLPQSVRSSRAHPDAVPTEQDAQTPLAPARIARRVHVQLCDHQRILGRHLRLVVKRRASHAQKRTCTPT